MNHDINNIFEEVIAMSFGKMLEVLTCILYSRMNPTYTMCFKFPSALGKVKLSFMSKGSFPY